MNRNHILLIEDEPAIRFALKEYLGVKGYEVTEADNCAAGLAAYQWKTPDAVIMDCELPDGNSIDLLPKLRAIDPNVPLIFLTGHGSIELAVRAIKEGADHFMTKPVELAALVKVLERALENQRNRRERLAGKSRQARDRIDPFIGESAVIRRLRTEVERLLAVDRPVLILGPTGAGKSLLARWMHDQGPRADEAFVDLNCAGLGRELLESELFGHEKGAFTGATAAKVGMLEVAHRGTVFLDEIGDMDLAVQPKMLTVLEDKRFRRLGDVRDRTVDIRLIAATHRDLSGMIAAGGFREDLFYRINTLTLTVPALRERLEDVPQLAGLILARIGRELGRQDLELTPQASAALQTHNWPGNIRELRNVLERAVLLCPGSVLSADLLRFDRRDPAPVPAPPSSLPTATRSENAAQSMDEMEKKHLEAALKAADNNVIKAAKALNIPRSTLYQKIKKYSL